MIFDSERTAKGQTLKPDLDKFGQTCEKLGFKTFATDLHSTENYITQATIDVVLGKPFLALGPYEVFGAASQKWAKDKNWLLFREMKKSDFANTELDEFIQKTLVPSVQKNS